MNFRHELKYFIHNSDIETLKLKLKAVMDSDPNQGEFGYNISSLYFDTIYNRFYDENNAGLSKRDKIRIRKYNHSNDLFKLEIKSKDTSLCYKQSQTISIDDVNNLMKLPYYQQNIADIKSVLNKVLLSNQLLCLKPSVIVDYDRYALVYKTGNVRITFDSHIKGNTYINQFIDNKALGINILKDNMAILEVKYDDILPNFIADILDSYHLNQTAFSKYYLCRQATEM